jgi:hypothetical protein
MDVELMLLTSEDQLISNYITPCLDDLQQVQYLSSDIVYQGTAKHLGYKFVLLSCAEYTLCSCVVHNSLLKFDY